ncbi:MAG: DUF4011 domain-containing protein, partial [Candidatus Bathyarchaeota archaeon]
MDSASLARVLRKVQDWKNKLIDLSRRNRLVNFRPTRSSTVEFERPGIDAVFERLVVQDRYWEIWSPPDEDELQGAWRRASRRPRKTQLVPSQVDSRQLERILRNLARRSTSEYRERGVRILYMTFGMVDWRETGINMPLKSPVVLTPVELTRKSSRDPYRIRVPAVEEEAILNPALRLKLQYDHQIELPPLPDFEEHRISDYLREVEEALTEMGWSVEPTVQMGLFSFYKLVMYQDLTDNLERIVEHPTIAALAGVAPPPIAEAPLPSEEELDSLDPKGTFQVLDADSSQQLCIQYALNGQSFVMHGPPGTGKSQTIANMIAEFIAAGRSILFVSEKMAALEVVYSRLKAKNLDDYCLELHSHKANKREVVAELSRSLSEHLKARGALTDEELERLVDRRDQLNGYVEALHTRRSPINMTPHQLFGRLTGLEETSFVPSEYSHFKTLHQRKLLDLEDTIRRLSNAWAVVEEGDAFPWRGCAEERFTPETRSGWIHLLDSTQGIIENLKEGAENYAQSLGLQTPRTIDDYERLQRLAEIISATPRPPMSWLEDADLRKLQNQAEANRKEWESYWSTVRELGKAYDSRFLVLPPGSAARVERAWNNAKELLAPISKGDGGLLRQMSELRDYLTSLPASLQAWREDAERIGKILGVKGEVQALERINQLSELARLCQGEVRPMRAWLDKKTLEETRELLEELKRDHAHRDELREKLEDYGEELLSLNLDGMVEWYEGPGSSLFRFLRPTHYRLKGDISRVNKRGIVPETVLEDLRNARELKTLEASLESNRPSARRALGIYHHGEEADFAGAEKALQVAAKAIRIVGRARSPKALRDNLCAGTQPGGELNTVSSRLSGSLTSWRTVTRRLKGLAPYRRLPTSGRSMQKSSLKELEDWANDLQDRLSQLSRVSAEALVTRISDHPQSLEGLIADLRTAEGLQGFEDEVERRSEELKASFGQLYTGLRTDWDGVLSAISWTRRLIRALPSGVQAALKRTVSEGGLPLPQDPRIAERWEKISGALDALDDRFEAPLYPEPRQGLVLSDMRNQLFRLQARIDDLQTWVDFKGLEKELREAELGGFLDRLITQGYNRTRLVGIFQKAVYQGLLDQVFEEDPTLKAFRGQDHEQLIADFKELDRKFIRLSAQRVIEIANEQKPRGVFVQAPDSEITILMREAAKKRRHMPLRHLFERIPNLVRRLKPCMMMSPISVSQFLIPGGLHFDLVVFDEASQIYSEDAVGSIYRGDTLVVAGDPKQLPPTPFFQYVIDEDFDWDEDAYEFDVFDSVLDECMSIGLPVKMLRWHYRSK